MRLAYADPPYPGKAHLYPENTEVDHAELVAQLAAYDGWALSTDERSLQYVHGLCPPGVRVLAWGRKNVPPLLPNPIAAWEPVLLSPARTDAEAVRSYLETDVPVGFMQRDGITGQKPAAFCEWVIRCLGAEPSDTLDDLFPGTGIMGETWRRWQAQPALFVQAARRPTGSAWANRVRRSNTPLAGLERDGNASIPERKPPLDKEKGEHLGSPLADDRSEAYPLSPDMQAVRRSGLPQTPREGDRSVEGGVVWIVVGVHVENGVAYLSRVREGSLAHRCWQERAGRAP